ncbi:MAG: DUF2877 domain-containing protein [Christensenellaceae bacterium]
MFYIINCSSFAYDTLRSVKRGLIHSVYNKTVNFYCGDVLLSLQAQGTPLSPLTLETNCSPQELNNLRLAPDMEIGISTHRICVNRTYFTFAFSSPWNPKLSEVLPDTPFLQSTNGVEFLCACLRSINPVDGFSDLVLPEGKLWKASQSAKAASLILSHCYNCILTEDWDVAAEHAAGLIGLGEGLTPSGDDFLCGMLAASHIAETKNSRELGMALAQKLRPLITKTNDISSAFINCALNGYFSSAIISLACGACIQKIAKDFSEIGHSSGADTLSGIIFYLGSLSADQFPLSQTI